jgi:signal transduction histidine kinase
LPSRASISDEWHPRCSVYLSELKACRMRLSGADFEQCGLDKKRTVLLLRSVVVVSLSYLVLFGRTDSTPSSIAYILALILSNVAISRLPAGLFRAPSFSKLLFLGDTAAVLAGLYYTVGISQDFLIVYFFTMFLTAAVDTVAQIAVGAVIVSIVYGCWLWTSSAVGLGSAEWLRLPFFFIIAVFYAYMTEEVKRERARRMQAERESEHLRFLLALGDGFAQRITNREWVGQVCGVVQTAFPRLSCTVHPQPPEGDTAAGSWFPISSDRHTFGCLRVTTRDGSRLSPDEDQFCRVVAYVAANALYTSQQVNAAAAAGARVKEEFLGTLSHELRTPLHAILGYADVLDSVLPRSGDVIARESVERLRANACRLQDLVEAMLWFAELRAGRCTVETEGVDVRELFKQCEIAMRNQLAGRPIRFAWEVGAGVTVLQSDRRKLRQIINGLLSNAAKFTDRGFIHLCARQVADQEVEIEVRDSGIGMDPRDFAVIFEEFRQLDGSLTRRVDGLGLGLALTQELAVLLGGRVDVESRRNGGAIFRVRLPVSLRAARPAQRTEAPAPSRRELALAAS